MGDAMTVHALLLAARTRIAKEEHWTQRYLARDREGRGVNPRSPHACAWCLVGAMEASFPVDADESVYWRAMDVIRSMCGQYVADFNDASEHASVVALFDAAINAESQRSDQ